jgi:hypothetical protein
MVRTILGAVVVALTTLTIAADSPKPYEVSGTGAFPLTDTVSSLWLNGPKQAGRPQPVIMVYYQGASGWHNTHWEVKSEFGKTPAWIRLTSPTAELSIEYGPGGVGSKVHGQSVNLSIANVFLVSPVGDTGVEPTIEPLGLVVFAVPEGANPAIQVLETNPAIKAKVLR